MPNGFTTMVFRRLRTFWHGRGRRSGRKVSAIVLALVFIAVGLVLTRQWLAQQDWTAIGTLSLALATVLAVLQARASGVSLNVHLYHNGIPDSFTISQ